MSDRGSLFWEVIVSDRGSRKKWTCPALWVCTVVICDIIQKSKKKWQILAQNENEKFSFFWTEIHHTFIIMCENMLINDILIKFNHIMASILNFNGFFMNFLTQFGLNIFLWIEYPSCTQQIILFIKLDFFDIPGTLWSSDQYKIIR